MTVRNPALFNQEHWDWGFLKAAGCFGTTKIEPTDIDGLVERNGYFLFKECKTPNVPINTGQDILHKALVDTGVFTVVRIWGFADQSNVTDIEVISHIRNIEKRNADTDYLIKFVRRWFYHVNTLPKANNETSRVQRLLAEISQLRSTSFLLLQEFLIEKSGRFMDDGFNKTIADIKASNLAFDLFNIPSDYSLGILANVE